MSMRTKKSSGGRRRGCGAGCRRGSRDRGRGQAASVSARCCVRFPARQSASITARYARVAVSASAMRGHALAKVIERLTAAPPPRCSAPPRSASSMVSPAMNRRAKLRSVPHAVARSERLERLTAGEELEESFGNGADHQCVRTVRRPGAQQMLDRSGVVPKHGAVADPETAAALEHGPCRAVSSGSARLVRPPRGRS